MDFDDSSLEAKGRLVFFDVLSVPLRKGEGVEGRGACVDAVVDVANDLEAAVVVSFGALSAGRLS